VVKFNHKEHKDFAQRAQRGIGYLLPLTSIVDMDCHFDQREKSHQTDGVEMTTC
jgi:hypothetical protein